MTIEKIAQDEMRERIAKALWVRRTSGPQAEMWDEYLAWYKDGASDPNSCVHHSSIAMALADADAVLALPYVSASYRAGAEGWQPIETAPKDGTAILATRPTPFPNEEACHVVRWDDDWWQVHDGKNDHPLRGDHLTGWLPLPDPQPQDGWRPMGTARKDGTVILVETVDGEVWAVRYVEPDPNWYDEWLAQADDTSDGVLRSFVSSDLTGWMPMPAPRRHTQESRDV